jgi:hypothetical protein
MWDQSDQCFIQFWRFVLSTPKLIFIIIGMIFIVWAIGSSFWSAFGDAFSNEIHYFNGVCCLNVVAFILGLLLVRRGSA